MLCLLVRDANTPRRHDRIDAVAVAHQDPTTITRPVLALRPNETCTQSVSLASWPWRGYRIRALRLDPRRRRGDTKSNRKDGLAVSGRPVSGSIS